MLEEADAKSSLSKRADDTMQGLGSPQLEKRSYPQVLVRAPFLFLAFGRLRGFRLPLRPRPRRVCHAARDASERAEPQLSGLIAAATVQKLHFSACFVAFVRAAAVAGSARQCRDPAV